MGKILEAIFDALGSPEVMFLGLVILCAIVAVTFAVGIYNAIMVGG